MKFEYMLNDCVTTVDILSYTPEKPGCRYLPSGDPGYPWEPAEVEIEVIDDRGECITPYLSEEELSEIEAEAIRRMEDFDEI